MTYKGEIVGESADGQRIVDADTWQRAVAILTDPTRRTAPGRPANTLLGGIVRCGRCGGPMAASKKDTTPVYVCSRNHHLTRRRALLDPAILAQAGDVVAALGARGLLAQADDDTDGEHTARQRIREAEDRLDALAALLASGDLDPAGFATADRKIRAGIGEDLAALAQRSRRPATARLASADDVAATWRSAVDTSDTATLREWLGELLTEVTVDPDGSATARWAGWTGLAPSQIAAAQVTPDQRAARREHVAALHATGASIQGMAKQLGVQRETIRRDLTALGLYEVTS